MDPWLTMFLYGQGGFHFHVRYSESQPLKHRFSFGFISSQVAPHTRPGGALRHGVAGDGEGLRPAASELPRALREPLRRHGALFSSPRLSTRGRPSATEGTHGRQVHHAPKDLAVDHRVAGWTFVLLGGWRRRNCLRVIWRLGCWRGHKGLERMGFSAALRPDGAQCHRPDDRLRLGGARGWACLELSPWFCNSSMFTSQ